MLHERVWCRGETWDNHAQISPGAAASDCLPPPFAVSVTFSTQKQRHGFKTHPPLPGQNQLLERWNSLIKWPNDNCCESAMIWLARQTAVGAERRVLTSKRAGLSMIIVGMIICSYSPPEVNINHLQKIGEQQGSDFTGGWCDLWWAVEQEMWEFTIACLTEALLSR